MFWNDIASFKQINFVVFGIIN